MLAFSLDLAVAILSPHFMQVSGFDSSMRNLARLPLTYTWQSLAVLAMQK